MNTLKSLSPMVIAIAVPLALLAGCSSTPATNPALDQARSDYRAAGSNPQTTNLAAAEFQVAGASLDRANASFNKGDKTPVVDHLAHIAGRQVAIARETGERKAAEQSVADANAERDRVRLDARTAEANAARRTAADATRDALESKRQADLAKLSADAERAAAAAALASADAARQKTIDTENYARQLEAQLRDLEAKKTARGTVITLGDVLFDSNRAELRSGGIRNLQKLATFLKAYPLRKIMIEGFTDSIGTPAQNEELSNQRTSAVRNALMGMGVGLDSIGTRGFGEAYPVASNDNAAGRQLNRRVEIIVSDDGGKIAPR